MAQALFSSPRWFDEGPVLTFLVKEATPGKYFNTGGIDLSSADDRRQGVEAASSRHSLRGIARLVTGDPGCTLRQADFGGVGPGSGSPSFFDDESVGSAGGDAPAADGALEPLELRAGILMQDVVRGAHGSLMGGTDDPRGGCAQITTQRPVVQDGRRAPYLDSVDALEWVPMQAPVLYPPGEIGPARDDVRRSGVRIPLGADAALASALEAMSPATDTYVDVGWTSAATGFDYGTAQQGDSIAFGGMDR